MIKYFICYDIICNGIVESGYSFRQASNEDELITKFIKDFEQIDNVKLSKMMYTELTNVYKVDLDFYKQKNS